MPKDAVPLNPLETEAALAHVTSWLQQEKGGGPAAVKAALADYVARCRR